MCHRLGRTQILFKGDGKLVDVEHLDIPIGIKNHVSQEIRDDKRVLRFFIMIIYNVTVPVEERVVFPVKFTDFIYGFK